MLSTSRDIGKRKFESGQKRLTPAVGFKPMSKDVFGSWSSPSLFPKIPNQVKSKSDVKKKISSQVQVKSTNIKVRFPLGLITPNTCDKCSNQVKSILKKKSSQRQSRSSHRKKIQVKSKSTTFYNIKVHFQ